MIRIDMPMPTCCEDCFAQSEYYNPRFDETEYSCGINGENLGTHSRQDCDGWHCDRPEWCPLKEQERRWIPVKEHMPDENEIVEIWQKYDGIVFTAYWHTAWWVVCGIKNKEFAHFEVSHWRKLQPPKECEQG